jgi:hypothetical protein
MNAHFVANKSQAILALKLSAKHALASRMISLSFKLIALRVLLPTIGSITYSSIHLKRADDGVTLFTP